GVQACGLPIWIVRGEKGGKVELVSKSGAKGMLPKGSFLTVEQNGSTFILRVDESQQADLFSPSPLVIDMDLSPLRQDQECRNIISAFRVKDLTNRNDG